MKKLGILIITIIFITPGCISINSKYKPPDQSAINRSTTQTSNLKTISKSNNVAKKIVPKQSNEVKSSFTYSKSSTKFNLVCTNPCTVNDKQFLDALFDGLKKGVSELEKSTGGVMPKNKIEYHAGQDRDCFINGYGEHPTGYYEVSSAGKAVICSSDYYWYKKLLGTSENRSYAYYRSLQSQTLLIHEAIHHVFNDYTAPGLNPPDYVIQESFAKAASLYALDVIKNYGDKFLRGNYTINNLPPKGSADNVNFFVYSLNKRFGFNSSQAKEFFKKYRADKSKISGNKKVKKILDEITGKDVKKSFDDVYAEVN